MALPWIDRLSGYLTPIQFDEARRHEGDVCTWLVTSHLLPAEELIDLLSDFYGRPGLLLGSYVPDPAAVALISEDVARRLSVLPLFVIGQSLYLAVTDPADLDTQDYCQQLTGLSIEPVVAVPHDLESAINRAQLSTEQATRNIGEIAGKIEETAAAQINEAVENKDAPAIRMVDHILAQAVHLGASDIHLEVYGTRIELRYRVDGTLHLFPPPPMAMHAAIVSRIKILAALDIGEKRLPQDGRMTARVDGVPVDTRIAVIPNLFGEGVVIRLLNTTAMERDLSSLGLSSAMLGQYEKLIRRPHGMLLVTGPTGSGKTTTLYATLRKLYTIERKFVTLEDPVEMQMDGITQIQVRPDIGLGFAEGLRSVLRYDPDVIMVGEIRDSESAEIALRSALTGHVLLSTLHTNDAPQAITRLIDMGLAPYVVLSALNGVLAQRLIRRLCPNCKQSAPPTSSELEALRLSALPERATPCRASGCDECGRLGYRGRIAVYELLEMTSELRRLASRNLDVIRLRTAAQQNRQFTSLFENARQRYLTGESSLQEVLALATED